MQQELVDKDAYVDAIYRTVVVKKKIEGLNVSFDSTAPAIVLLNEVFCPFNAQNTLFHYGTCWSLLLPVIVMFRVIDILRWYLSQRLFCLTDN